MKKILIIEDTEAVSVMLEKVLSLKGYSTKTALNGIIALELLAEDPNYDLILLDYQMPGMDGIQFRRIQLENHLIADIPTVCTSGDPSDIEAEKNLGLTHFIKKPFTPKELLDLVKSLLGE